MINVNESLDRLIDVVLSAVREPCSGARASLRDRLAEVLRTILASLDGGGRGWRGIIFLPDVAKRTLEPSAQAGNGSSCQAHSCALDQESTIARVALRRIPEHRREGGENGQGGHTQVVLPLIGRGAATGVLSLESDEAKVLEPTELDYLNKAAALAALLLQQQQLEQAGEDRDFFRTAYYALKERKVLHAPPITRTEDDIRRLLESEDTLDKLIEEISALEGEDHAGCP